MRLSLVFIGAALMAIVLIPGVFMLVLVVLGAIASAF